MASTLVSSSSIIGERESGDEFTTASRQGEKATASCDQTRQSRANNWPWNLYKADEGVRAVV